MMNGMWKDGRGKEIPIRLMPTKYVVNCVKFLSRTLRDLFAATHDPLRSKEEIDLLFEEIAELDQKKYELELELKERNNSRL